MKSRFGNVGNINLHGRKTHRLSCGCCTMQDFRDRERERQARQDIDEAICLDDDLDIPDVYTIDGWERQIDPEFDQMIKQTLALSSTGRATDSDSVGSTFES